MINLKRGLLRAWVVIAVAWIGLMGWHEYTETSWIICTDGECWDRLAKWPDGQPFDGWDIYFDQVDTPENIDSNQKKHAWAPDQIPERNRWVAATRQKLRECEATAPIIRRLSVMLTRIRSSLKDSLLIILLPPFALLIAGYVIGWVVRGFRAQA
jgi:hypothetical protein